MFARFLVMAPALLAAAACSEKPSPPAETPQALAPVPRVGGIMLGRAIGPDNRVTDTTSRFSPRDTFFVAVPTEYTPAGAALIARWTYQTGQLVDSTTQPIASPSGADPVTVTEFHVAKAGGWPVGKYKVEVALNGAIQATREFEVVKK